MTRNEQMRIASALAEISIQVTRRCKEDYLYELVAIVDSLDRGEDYVLFAREGGADGMNRFGDFEDIHEGIKVAKASLGVDCAFVFRWNEKKGNFKVDILNVSLDKSTMYQLKSGFDCRLILYNEIN